MGEAIQNISKMEEKIINLHCIRTLQIQKRIQNETYMVILQLLKQYLLITHELTCKN